MFYESVKCPFCEWSGKEDDLLVDENPFRSPRMYGIKELIYGCPKCESVFEEIPYENE